MQGSLNIVDSIHKLQTLLARVTSVRRWIAVRIIQRFVRDILYEDDQDSFLREEDDAGFNLWREGKRVTLLTSHH